jgi:hypothetical protein
MSVRLDNAWKLASVHIFVRARSEGLCDDNQRWHSMDKVCVMIGRHTCMNRGGSGK